MRMKSLILIFIALGCGLVASIGISQVMERGGTQVATLEVEQILVALGDIDIGSQLDAQTVQLEDWPKAKIQEGALRSLDEVKDKFALTRFIKGEPILVGKITDRKGNVTDTIPEGYRAIPVKVDEDTVLKAITPGDRVDVMVFLRKGEEIPKTGVFTILRNVRVFAVNTNTERSVDKGPEANFRTVSLLLKPAHAQEMALAAQMGKVMLTLRRPNEQDDLAGEQITPIGDILNGKADVATEAVLPSDVPSPSANQNLLDILGNTPTQQMPVVPSALLPEFEMVIYGPADVKKYEWAKRDGMPVEASSLSTAPAAAEPTTEPAEEPTSEPTTPEPATEPAAPANPD